MQYPATDLYVSIRLLAAKPKNDMMTQWDGPGFYVNAASSEGYNRIMDAKVPDAFALTAFGAISPILKVEGERALATVHRQEREQLDRLRQQRSELDRRIRQIEALDD